MKILISGASGLVGTNLIPVLKGKGHAIFRLVRKPPGDVDEIQWDPETGFSDAELPKLENFDAVIHLAGDNIASENWNEEKKRKIRSSRVEGTRVLVDALKTLKNPPQIFISASATGFYGDRQNQVLNEESAKGEGFLPDVCAEWEAESFKAERFGARVVTPRLGIVLAKEGGALEKMLTPFKLGVGGTIGNGRQWMSWIAIEDVKRVFLFALENKNLRGAVNAVSPNPVTNQEFTKTLGRILHRPTVLPAPAFAIRLMFGEMGDALLLAGARVLPEKLQEAGFEFEYPNLEEALKAVLK